MKAERVNEDRGTQGVGLTSYELTVLAMMAEGADLAEIAEATATTREAVNKQISLIRFKLNVPTDVQAVVLAQERGWI